jgi:hypothetical protein
MKPRKYFPATIKYGFAPACVDEGMLLTGLYAPGVSETIDACQAECDRLNNEQVTTAQAALAAAAKQWTDVQSTFNL